MRPGHKRLTAVDIAIIEKLERNKEKKRIDRAVRRCDPPPPCSVYWSAAVDALRRAVPAGVVLDVVIRSTVEGTLERRAILTSTGSPTNGRPLIDVVVFDDAGDPVVVAAYRRRITGRDFRAIHAKLLFIADGVEQVDRTITEIARRVWRGH